MLVGKDFVFVHIPKNAGTFIRTFLGKENIGRSLKKWHLPVHEIPVCHNRKKIVACIKNPFDYYISLYEYQRKKPVRLNDRWYNFWRPHNVSFDQFIKTVLGDNSRLETCKMDLALGSNPYQPVFRWMINNDIGFYTVRYVYMSFFQYSILDQRRLFEKHDELCAVNEMMKCESLNQDMTRVFHLNTLQKKRLEETKFMNKSRKMPSKEYYTQETKDLVAQKDRLILQKYYEAYCENIFR